jgi:hypothetical protein
MAPMERFIFWAISRDFISEMISFRSISSSVSVQERPAGRGPVISPSPSAQLFPDGGLFGFQSLFGQTKEDLILRTLLLLFDPALP